MRRLYLNKHVETLFSFISLLNHVSPEVFRQFKEHSERYSNMLITTRQKFYADKIEANSGDQKVLFHVLNKLLHRKKDRQFPPHDSLDHLTNKFADFFVKKIDMIKSYQFF